MYSQVDEVKEKLRNDALDQFMDPNLTEEEKQVQIVSLIEESIGDADGTIDGYLGTRYPVPIQNPNRMINNLSKDIALFNLYSRIGIEEDTRENTILRRYQNAIKFLEKVAEGKIDMGFTSGETQKPISTLKVKSSQRIFSRESMRGF